MRSLHSSPALAKRSAARVPHWCSGLLLAISGVCGMMLSAPICAAEEPIALAIHGGAGTLLRAELSAEKEAAIRAALEQALRSGHAVLSDGGDSLEAVVAAIQVLENSPHFNAAKGAVLNEDGEVELDASLMRGSDRDAGAVAGVHGVKNPILLARAVMEHSPHVLLSGNGAEQFARSQGLAFEPPDYFKTHHRLEQWQKLKAQRDQATAAHDTTAAEVETRWFSTVGAVARDRQGHLAAGTSTGGTALKRWGRIGDSPIIGAGTYADDRYCAISATGHGEYFIRAAVAHDICARVRYQGLSIQQAADQVVHEELVQMGGDGGIIAVGADGSVAMPFNTPGMYRGAIYADGQIEIAIFKDEAVKDAPKP